MKNLTLVFAAAWLLSLCGITSAQDRGFASAIEWSPDGETIAVASTNGVWFFDTLFNELGYVELRQGKYIVSPRSLAWNADGDLVAIGYTEFTDSEHPVQIIDVTRFEVITEIEVLALWTQVVWHPTDNLIAVGNWPGEAFVLDALTGEVFFYFQEQENDEQTNHSWNSTMAVCWFSKSVIAVITQWETYVIDVELNEILQSFDIRNQFHPPECHDEHKIINAQRGMFHVETGAFSETYTPWRDDNDFSLIEKIFPDSSKMPTHVQDQEFSPDGNKILSNVEGCRITVFDTRNGKLLAPIRGGIYFVQFSYTPFQDSVAWHPDGSRFAAVGQFGGIRIWDGETYELLQRYDGFQAGYGELSGVLDYYGEEDLHQIEAFKKKCIEELNSELPKM